MIGLYNISIEIRKRRYASRFRWVIIPSALKLGRGWLLLKGLRKEYPCYICVACTRFINEPYFNFYSSI